MTSVSTQSVVPRPPVDIKSKEWTNGVEHAPKNVDWYQAALSRVPSTAKEIFREYSKIPDEKILEHIHTVRDKAWEILPYPCIGLFRFLDFPACLSPIYPEVLSRVRQGQTFLDLGCCFGQDIRKLVYDGAPSDNIIGVDLEPRFLKLGYDLFCDRETLKARFYTGDIFDENFLGDFRGKVDIIFVGSFLHLFTFDQQQLIVAQLVKLLRPRKNSLVFGRHLATTAQGGTTAANACGWSLYHHSSGTIRQLWHAAPEGEWEVSSELVRYASEGWDNGVTYLKGGDESKKQMYFSAYRK